MPLPSNAQLSELDDVTVTLQGALPIRPDAIRPAGECGPGGFTVTRMWLVVGARQRLLAGERGDADGGGDHDRDGPGEQAAPPVPDLPAGQHGCLHRGGARLDRGERGRQVLVQVAHWSSPSMSSALPRKAASARDAWLLTVPTEQSSAAAVSASDMSIQKRSTITARWRGPSLRSAFSSASLSPSGVGGPADRQPGRLPAPRRPGARPPGACGTGCCSR